MKKGSNKNFSWLHCSERYSIFFLSCQQAGTGSVCDTYIVLKLSVWWLLMNHLIYESPVRAKSLQLCLNLCDPMDCSPPDSSVRGILQARILKWVAMPCFRGSSRPRDQTGISCFPHRQAGSLPLVPPEKPINHLDP